MSGYTPSAEELVLAAVNIPENEARRGIAKVREEARAEARAEFVLTRESIRKIKADTLREAKDSVLAYDGSSFLRYLKETDRAVVEQWLHECAEKIEGDSNE